MGQLSFRDDLFDDPARNWGQKHIDERFRHRYLHQKGAIHCETVMVVPGLVDTNAAIDLICGPWNWWKHGRTTGFATNRDGSSDQRLSPVWWFITRVNLHIHPPVYLPELNGLRVPILLTGHFTGTSSMDVFRGKSGEALIIRGRFHGVDYHVPGVPNEVAEYLHLAAESGSMPAPFPKGTGWVGLLEKLEARTTDNPQVMDLVRLSVSIGRTSAGQPSSAPAIK